ncbi:MAG: heavy metal translocating P-type ATPase [Caldimonas sp.]
MPAQLALDSADEPPSVDAEAAVADDPGADAGFTSWSNAADGRRIGRSHLQLAGLWCAGCAGLIEQALLGEPGVLEARVSYAAQRASVAWDPAATRLSRILAVVRNAGYGAAPDAAAPARALRQAESRSALWRLFVAVFCMMQVMMYQAPVYFASPGTLTPDLRSLLLWAAWLLSIPVVLFSAAPLFRDAFSGLRRRRIGMDLPVALGIAITFVVSSGATFDPGGVFGREAYFDSLTMFVSFLLGGRYLALKMRHRVTATLEAAVARLPEAVRRLDDEGRVTLVALHRLRRGDRVRVLVGEAFPADGPLLDGTTEADEAMLTGESRPVAKQPGDEAIAGSLNLRGPVVQRVERLGAETRYEGIVALMREALVDRPPVLRSADRVAGPFLWTVLLLAAGAGAAWSVIDPSRAVWVAVSVLIVTCPCALSLAAPAALLSAAGALARRGVLVQRLDALEALASVDTVCFDKTGTLTAATLRVAAVELQPAGRRAGLDETSVRALAASLAAASAHPLSLALVDPGAAPRSWSALRELPGAGLEGTASDGARYRLGSAAWVAAAPGSAESGPQTWLGGPDGPLARFTFEETLRPDAPATIAALRRAGLAITLLSGDADERVRRVAARLGVAQARGGASPADKLAAVAELQRQGHRVAMVGDGLNDAPVMARADVSFAIEDGAALTRARADFILMSGSLADVAGARETARRALRVVRQNLGWAIAYNATCVPLALAGWFPPWAAGLGMAASSLVVVVNALRIDRAVSNRSSSGDPLP